MAWLATDRRVAMGEAYPFEYRYLTWLVKVAAVAERNASPPLDAVQLDAWECDGLGPPPWAVEALPLMPSRDRSILALWREFSAKVRESSASADFYAEKGAEWLAPVMRDVVPTQTIYLVRDPRDVFLSASAFVRRTGAIGFGGDGTPLEQARHIARRMLSLHENARQDKGLPRCVQVRYEDMLQRRGTVASRIRETLGIDVSPSPPTLGQHERQHRTSQGDEESLQRWQRDGLDRDVQSCLESQLHELMAEHGYRRELAEAPPVDVRLEECTLSSPDGVLAPGGDRHVVTITGGDFGLNLAADARRIHATHEIWACVRGGTGDHCSVYWRRHHEAYGEERVVHVPFRPGPHWQIVRLPLARQRSWTHDASALRLDLFNGRVTVGSRGEVRWVRLVP